NESGEQIECIGHEIPDNTSVASSVSSVTRKKRKRYDDEIDVSDIVDKVDILIDRVEELGVNVADYRSEIRNIATEIFLDFKDDVVKEVRGAVKEEVREVVKEEVQLRKVISGNSDGKTEQVKKTNEQLLYAEKVKNSKTETVVVEPKEKQDSRTTFTEVKSKVKIGKLGVGVEKLKKTKSGKVVIGCVGKEDREKLASELKENMGEKYNIRLTVKKAPKNQNYRCR
ncbi:GSCOCG00010911001-RA-CDS, partial [Cotesia congregata]